MKKYDNLCAWSKRSRAEIGDRLCKTLDIDCTLLSDEMHNTVEEEVCGIMISVPGRDDVSGEYRLIENGYCLETDEVSFFLSLHTEVSYFEVKRLAKNEN